MCFLCSLYSYAEVLPCNPTLGDGFWNLCTPEGDCCPSKRRQWVGFQPSNPSVFYHRRTLRKPRNLPECNQLGSGWVMDLPVSRTLRSIDCWSWETSQWVKMQDWHELDTYNPQNGDCSEASSYGGSLSSTCVCGCSHTSPLSWWCMHINQSINKCNKTVLRHLIRGILLY